MDIATLGRSDGQFTVCRGHEPGECPTDPKKNEVKPWQVKGWVIPQAGPEFVCAMEDVLTEYAKPYDPTHPRVCLDESPKQLISERHASFTDAHGVEHIDYEYCREGTVDLYMIVEPLGGRREVVVKEHHTRLDYAHVLAHIVEDMYPTAARVTIIQDNLSAHKKSALYEVFEPARARAILEKVEFVFTPKHGSWLNVAECELSVLTRQGLKDRVATKEAVIEQVTAWYAARNEHSTSVDWQFTTKDARIKLKRFYPSIKP